TIEKFKSNAGYTTSNEGITKKIQFERSKDTTKITTGNNGTFPKKWCKSFSRVFTYFCTNASINSHLSCYNENRRYPRPYVFMVWLRFSRLYFTINSRGSDFLTAKINDVRKSGFSESTNGSNALSDAYYDNCICFLLPICVSTLLGSRKRIYGCTNYFH